MDPSLEGGGKGFGRLEKGEKETSCQSSVISHQSSVAGNWKLITDKCKAGRPQPPRRHPVSDC